MLKHPSRVDGPGLGRVGPAPGNIARIAALRPAARLRGCSGFTLTELLVVIATIVVLTKMLGPSYEANRREQNKSLAKNVVKDFGEAICLHYQKTGVFPSSADDLQDDVDLGVYLQFFSGTTGYQYTFVQKESRTSEPALIDGSDSLLAEGTKEPLTKKVKGVEVIAKPVDWDQAQDNDVDATTVTIVVKPGSEELAPINLGAKGVLPVAIPSSADFDATTVNWVTARLHDPEGFESVAPLRSQLEDVDGDGDTDLVLAFSVETAVTVGAIGPQTTSVRIRAATIYDENVVGEQAVCIVP